MAWRFRLGERLMPQGMAKLAEYVQSQDHTTMGDLDEATYSGIFRIPHDPAPVEAVKMCLEMADQTL